MKKIGSFFFTFVPLLLALSLQFAALFFAMGVSLLWENLWYGYGTIHRLSFTEIYTDLVVLWSNNRFNTSVMILFSLFCIGIFGLWYYSRYEGEFLPEHPGFFRPCSVFGIILLAPATQVLTSFLISIIAMIFPAWLKAYETLIESAGMNDVTLPVICYSVLLAPFSEELIFRGVTMRQAKKVLPFWAANLFQAILFGVFHMNILQGIYACCLGLVMGYICEKCGSIYYSIFFHFLYNLLGTVVMTSINIGSTPTSVILSFFVSVIAAVSGFLLLQVRSQKTD